jgi:enoyl-CoA hydratase/3-hydroxyacyl-CoA dehydrogenase
MGSGIAQKLAQEGFTVVMNDMSTEFVEKGMERIRTLLGEAVERRIFTAEKVEEIMGRITPTAELADLAECGVVIEAIFEDEAVKKELFSKLDKIIAPTAILATNTSSFYVTNIAKGIQNPERVVGLHFFFHPAKNRLVEVIPGEETSDEVVERCLELAFAMGKTPIVCSDRPGFVVNRFFVPWLNESVRLLERGVADLATIEAAAKKAFSIGMGPFELMNVTGVPIAWHAEATLGRELGSYYEPCAKLIEAGGANQLWPLDGEVDESKFAAVAAHLRGVVFQVAGEIIDEDICRLEDVDRGAKIGLRWVRGPFELMNRLGVDKAIAEAEGFCEASGHTLSPTLAAQAAKGGDWPLRWVDLEVKDGAATITINRPEAMNSLNEEVMRDLAELFDRAAADPAVKGIIIAGAGKAFIAGADIGFFLKRMKENDLARIESFTRAGAATFRKIETCEKPVIALADGLTLGGGSELALACHAIIATEKSRFAFPETSIGIYPGLGGTQRLPRIVGRELGRYMILSNAALSGKDAFAIGLTGYYCQSDDAKGLAFELATSGPVKDKYAAKPTAAGWEAVVEAFSGTGTELNDGGEDKRLQRAAKAISGGAPIAQKLCAQFIEEGLTLDIEAGLELELSNLQKIFATADALEGLTSLGRRRPAFKGE